MNILTKSKSLIWFFLLAMALSWFPGFLAALVPEKYGGLAFFSTFGPALAALIVAAVAEGAAGIKKLLRALFQWQVKLIWYLIVLLGPAVMMVAVFLLYSPFHHGASLPDLSKWFSTLSQQAFALVVIFLFMWFTVCGEEIGWRGFALPKLQRAYHPLLASLILGAIWGVWHLPLFFTKDSMQSQMGFSYFFFATLGYSILYSWIYNGAKESVWIISLFHAANNTTVTYTMLFFKPLVHEPVFSLIVLGLFDLLVILLSKGTLLYQKEEKSQHKTDKIQQSSAAQIN